MSLKQLLGLSETGISEFEIMKKLRKAQMRKIEEVDFEKVDGSVIRIKLPHVGFDPELFKER
jgi:hypothetical protein